MILKHLRKLQFFLCICLALATLLIGFSPYVIAQEPETGEVKTSGEGLISRVAPGEFLPISVKLANFGGGRRVDVTIDYQILDSSNVVVLTETETVAVETTASYVKIIQIPHDLPPGRYTAFSNIIYEGQEVPATAQFQFTVEKKIAGIFVSQFTLYSVITILISIAFVVVSRLIIKRRRASRLIPHDYSDVPKQDRMFYEIISDIIMQMRYRVGEKALDIAKNIGDLVHNEKNGKVLEIKKSPAKIIALLVLQYEKHLGEKISFAVRKPGEETEGRLATVEKNLIVVRKYFE